MTDNTTTFEPQRFCKDCTNIHIDVPAQCNQGQDSRFDLVTGLKTFRELFPLDCLKDSKEDVPK